MGARAQQVHGVLGAARPAGGSSGSDRASCCGDRAGGGRWRPEGPAPRRFWEAATGRAAFWVGGGAERVPRSCPCRWWKRRLRGPRPGASRRGRRTRSVLPWGAWDFVGVGAHGGGGDADISHARGPRAGWCPWGYLGVGRGQLFIGRVFSYPWTQSPGLLAPLRAHRAPKAGAVPGAVRARCGGPCVRCVASAGWASSFQGCYLLQLLAGHNRGTGTDAPHALKRCRNLKKTRPRTTGPVWKVGVGMTVALSLSAQFSFFAHYPPVFSLHADVFYVNKPYFIDTTLYVNF